MTGVLQGTIACWHPVERALLPPPAAVLADDRPFANLCLISLSPLFCCWSKGLCRGCCRHRLLPAQAAAACGNCCGTARGGQARHLLGKRRPCVQQSFVSFLSFSLFSLSKAELVGEGGSQTFKMASAAQWLPCGAQGNDKSYSRWSGCCLVTVKQTPQFSLLCVASKTGAYHEVWMDIYGFWGVTPKFMSMFSSGFLQKSLSWALRGFTHQRCDVGVVPASRGPMDAKR